MRRRAVAAEASTRQPQETASPRATRSADGSLNFQVEVLLAIADELLPLLVRHHQEIERDGMPLEPDWDEWYRNNGIGVLRILTARTREGRLVGYIFNIVRPNLHCKSILHCFVEGFWLSPAYRFGWTPVEFFLENERLLKEWGVRRTYLTAELAYQDGRARSIFRRLGYKLTAEVWTKVQP